MKNFFTNGCTLMFCLRPERCVGKSKRRKVSHKEYIVLKYMMCVVIKCILIRDFATATCNIA